MPHEDGRLHTLHFDTCRGVFQGGGCRGAALAGAFQAADEAGVHFAEVAGASAGSIIAALVGAGATPEFVVEKVRSLEFPALLEPPLKVGGMSGVGWWFAEKALRIFGKTNLADAIARGGFHSSAGIQEWVEELLRETLRLKEKVLFRHLLIPTYVVATDLGNGTARIWSTERTPEDSVAFAVRASCSIPIYFQPVEQDDYRFVDGGLLSNLPAFVFNRDDNHQAMARRILAFRLVNDSNPPRHWDTRQVASRCIEAVIGGATEIQVALQDEVHPIEINTGEIRSTDFDSMDADKIDTLIAQGRSAVIEFIRGETGNLRKLAREALYMDEESVRAAVVEEAESKAEEVIVAQPDTEWYWKMFPTVMNWRRHGTRVRVLVKEPTGEEKLVRRERTRRKNLAGLGVEIETVQRLDLRGFVVVRESQRDSAAIVYVPQTSQHAPRAILYGGKAQQAVVSTIRRSMAAALTDQGVAPDHVPELEVVDNQDLCLMLKNGVAQYTHDNVKLSIEEVKVSDIRSVTKLIYSYKYRQAAHLIQLFTESDIQLFAPSAVRMSDGSRSVVAPPVVEIHGDRMVGIEGNSRTYFCWRHGIETIKAVVVRNVREAPPGIGVDLRNVRLISCNLPPAQRMPGFEYGLFRRIEGAVHPLLPISTDGP